MGDDRRAPHPEDSVMRTIIDWWVELDPTFAFLLALPLIVTAAAFIGEGVRRAWRVRATRRFAARKATAPRLKQRAWG